MINVEIGTLDKKISIIAYQDAEDEYGLTHQEKADVFGHRIWARVEPFRGKEYYEQFKDKVEEIVKVTIRYRPGINENMLIQYHDAVYEIQTISDPYMAHVKLEIMCKRLKRGASDED